MFREWLIAGLLGLMPSLALMGQQAETPFARWEAPALVPPTDSLVGSRGDYRYEGLAFGGLVFGALGAWLATRDFEACALDVGTSCGRDDDKLGQGLVGGLVGAAVGGGLGYLVGRFSPKRPWPALPAKSTELASVPDSVRIRTGYQHWRGAGIGLAMGTGLGALTGAVLSSLDYCSDCERPSLGEGVVMVGLLGAGVGGVVGFLAGLSSPKYITIPAANPVE